MVSKGNRREVRDKGDGISLALKEVEFGSLKSQKVVVGRRLLKVGRGRML